MKAGPIVTNLCDVRARIDATARRSSRDPSEITLIAVSKTQSVEKILEVLGSGQRVFGENYVQEARRKFVGLPPIIGTELHLIGPLQRNKIKIAVGLFDCIHTVGSIEVASALASSSAALAKRLRVFVQVNISGEPSKSGIQPEEAQHLISSMLNSPEIRENLLLEGLMTIGSYVDPGAPDAERRRDFINLRRVRDEIQQRLSVPLPHLSMGMSHDFELAVEEGASYLRVGSAIFGERAHSNK